MQTFLISISFLKAIDIGQLYGAAEQPTEKNRQNIFLTRPWLQHRIYPIFNLNFRMPVSQQFIWTSLLLNFAFLSIFPYQRGSGMKKWHESTWKDFIALAKRKPIQFSFSAHGKQTCETEWKKIER